MLCASPISERDQPNSEDKAGKKAVRLNRLIGPMAPTTNRAERTRHPEKVLFLVIVFN